MEFKCRICGGQVQIDRALGICICEYCGTKQALPQFTDESSKRLFDSGNNYLQNSEYDKAENVFNQLLAQNPQDAEIYWDLVLCKYGVTFVCDPRTGKYVPTCNRTHYDSILNDKNYQCALSYSSGEKNEFYRESAKTIDEIQKGIVSVAKKEKPFDIFISYKETDANGNRTKDSVVAQELYEKLVAAGYKVFFSRITFENKIGSEYEPYIYAALASSKVMLTVSSSRNNIEAPWVKNEWSRFLTLRQADASKTLIPLFFDMSREELPAEFEIFSAQDISKPDYEQDLIRGIKKLIPLPVMLAAKRKKRKKQAKIIGITAACIILVSGAVGFPYIKDYAENIGNYNSAMELYNDGSYDDAKKAFALLGDFKNSKEMMQTCDYDTAMQLYYDGDYPQAAWAFRDMAKFKDSLDMQKKAELAWRRSLANVATDDLDEYSNSYYVINENGTVSGVDGNANFGLSIEKHGRIVSITASSKKLYALHEDGYVDNCKENNRLTDESEWHDIIKISRQLYSTNIALRADGTMLYGNTEFDDYRNDDWIKDIEQWTDIVDFELDYRDGLAYSFGIGAVIGIKSDGSLCTVYNDENDIRLQYKSFGSQGIGLETFTAEKLNAIVKEFSNVKSLSFQIVDDVDPINIMAITKDGKLLTYKNGKLNQSDAGDICTTFYASFMLKTNGDLVRCSDNKTVMHDIAKVCYEGHMIPYAITKTGNVYNCVTSGTSGEEVWEKLNVKTLAYDEWISRLN